MQGNNDSKFIFKREILFISLFVVTGAVERIKHKQTRMMEAAGEVASHGNPYIDQARGNTSAYHGSLPSL